MESSSHYDYLFKVVVIGDIECGKTSIMNRFIEGTFDEESATISVDYKEKILEVNDKSIKLQVWDTAGLERFKAINNSFYRGTYGIIVVYDVTNKDSFGNTSIWLKEISYYPGKGVQKILVGNKCDNSTTRVVTYTEGKNFAEKENIEFIETSAKDGKNINELFELMTKEILELQATKPSDIVDIGAQINSESNCSC